MNLIAETEPMVSHEDIAHLAYINWQKDGCPHGHDETYWLEAERQLRATKHLLSHEIKQRAPALAAAKPRSKRAQKSSARPFSAR
jgi:hypothetical protein